MHSFAQTNIQLFNQLQELGYGAEDIQFVDDAYQVAVSLFAGAFRPSGKPFLSHLVGTASILAWLRAPRNAIVTGLLHSAYSHGEFGPGWCGMVDTKRQYLVQAIGSEVEELVASYTNLTWDARSIPAISAKFDALSAADRAALLVRLANELEDHLDLGVLYCSDTERRIQYIQSTRAGCLELAARLGCADLAEALDRQFHEVLRTRVCLNLRSRFKESYRVVPFARSDWRKNRVRYIMGWKLKSRPPLSLR